MFYLQGITPGDGPVLFTVIKHSLRSYLASTKILQCIIFSRRSIPVGSEDFIGPVLFDVFSTFADVWTSFVQRRLLSTEEQLFREKLAYCGLEKT